MQNQPTFIELLGDNQNNGKFISLFSLIIHNYAKSALLVDVAKGILGDETLAGWHALLPSLSHSRQAITWYKMDLTRSHLSRCPHRSGKKIILMFWQSKRSRSA